MGSSSTISDRDLALEARDIEVVYRMPAVRTTTFKEAVIARLRGQRQEVVTKALGGVSLSARRGECVALIGHNGCGKSTFLKVMAGILTPTSGTIQAVGRVAPLIELGAGFDPELTGRENVYLSCSLMGLTRKEIEDRIGGIEEFAELGHFFEAPVKTYSSGMYMRLGFACTTAIDADLLLIDEILAVGDENFQKKCMRRMYETREKGVTTILVTHDLGTVERLADRAILLNHGQLLSDGKPAETILAYHRLLEEERLAKIPAAERREQERRERLKTNDANVQLAAPGSARILSARAVGPDPFSPLIAGKPWSIILDIEVDLPFSEPPVVGFAVNTTSGLRVFGGNTTNAPPLTDLGRLKSRGVHTVSFGFEQQPLASGRYALVAAIHSDKLDRTIEIRVAQTFDVVDPGDPHNFDHDMIAGCLRTVAFGIETAAR